MRIAATTSAALGWPLPPQPAHKALLSTRLERAALLSRGARGERRLRIHLPISGATGGHFRGEHGGAGAPGYLLLEGTIQPDGSAMLMEKHLDVENPYYQYFSGEVSFCHKLPFDRSSLDALAAAAGGGAAR